MQRPRNIPWLAGSWSGALPDWAGDLKVITAGMSQVRPHFDE